MSPTDISWAFFGCVVITVAIFAIDAVSAAGAPVAFMVFH